MVFVAAIFLKLAQLFGITTFFERQWLDAYGVGGGWVLVIAIAVVMVALAYVGWFGIRLPYLIARYRDIRKRRIRRREQLEAEVDKARKF